MLNILEQKQNIYESKLLNNNYEKQNNIKDKLDNEYKNLIFYPSSNKE
jgi:cell division protein FtsL